MSQAANLTQENELLNNKNRELKEHLLALNKRFAFISSNVNLNSMILNQP